MAISGKKCLGGGKFFGSGAPSPHLSATLAERHTLTKEEDRNSCVQFGNILGTICQSLSFLTVINYYFEQFKEFEGRASNS